MSGNVGLAQSSDIASPSPLHSLVVRVVPCSAWAGLAKVYLEVAPMRYNGRQFVGGYDFRVPLMKSKSETGRITLPCPDAGTLILTNGGSLCGKGLSDKVGMPERGITADLQPDSKNPGQGSIVLTIDTGHRLVVFRSQYFLESVLEQANHPPATAKTPGA